MERTVIPQHRVCRTYRWSDNGRQYARGCILVGHCPDTLPYFLAMFRLAKKSFPQLKSSNVRCGKIVSSHTCKGFTAIVFDIPPEQAVQDGWTCFDSRIEFSL